MPRNLTWRQARGIARQGRAVRAEPWRRWLVFHAVSGTWWEILPAAADDSYPQTTRIARSVSASGGTPDDANFIFAGADFDRRDWTDEPWDVASPPPVVAPADEPSTDVLAGRIPSPPPLRIVYPPGVPFSPIPGSGGRVVPHNPPVAAPVITVSYQTDLVPEGNACLLESQSDDGETCLVIMTVSIAGGPAGVHDLHVQLGATVKPAVNGFAGYTEDFAFLVPVNPGGSLTPTIIYGIPAGDVTVNTPTFAFPPACKVVGFNSNGGTGFMNQQASGVPQALHTCTFTRDGFVFTGWKTAPTSGTSYADGAVYNFAADVSLYAQWASSFTVTFLGNEATGGIMTPQTSAAPAALQANAFSRVGFIFAGWNTAADGSGTDYAAGATYDFEANLTLHAQWEAVERTVTFLPNGGAGSMSLQTQNSPTDLIANEYTRAGYVFTGWNTAENGSGTAYADEATYDFAADLTLHAQWEPAPHTVTFDGNGSDGGSMSPQTANATTSLTANAFTLTGSTFTGWNTEADGSGTDYADGASYGFTEDLTLFAQWS